MILTNSKVNKIFIAGNIAGGKSVLAKALSRNYGLPVTHVDSVQFLPGMVIRPLGETRETMNQIESKAQWIIDGYGPFDQIEKRMAKADLVIFLDWPLWRHLFWLSKRQAWSAFKPREELPRGCYEFRWGHTVKLFKTLMGMHSQMRPELLRIFQKEHLRNKVLIVRNKKMFKSLLKSSDFQSLMPVEKK